MKDKLLRLLGILERFYLDIKVSLISAYEEINYGIADKDTWDLFDTTAQFVLPRLKRFRQLTNGTPVGLTEEQWNKILDDMILAFKLITTMDEWEWKRGRVVRYRKIQHGLNLFAKYYLNLWW